MDNYRKSERRRNIYQSLQYEQWIPHFADVYNLKLAAGQIFFKEFSDRYVKSCMVNEAAVRTFGWQKPENAIGKSFGKGDDAADL